MYQILLGIVLIALSLSPAISATRQLVRSLCEDSLYYCMRVQGGDSWESLFPDTTARELVMRVNRMNTPLYRGLVIAIPKDLENTSTLDVAPFAHVIPATGEKLIYVNPSKYAWAAYDERGELVHWGPMSGGKDWCPDVNRGCRTVVGRFRVYSRGSEDCISTKFPIPEGGAPMPFCMFFHGGYALHASPDVPGYHASHGCIRIFYNDAEWLNREFIDVPEYGTVGTRVIVMPYHASDDRAQAEDDEYVE